MGTWAAAAAAANYFLTSNDKGKTIFLLSYTYTCIRVAQAIAAISGKLVTDSFLPIESNRHKLNTQNCKLKMSFQK